MISELMIHSVETGTDRLLLRHEGHIEAPNWAPDGRSLIVNGDGRLYRLALPAVLRDELQHGEAAGVAAEALPLSAIDCGFAQHCNNDHGLSPDGQWLAISDSTEHGASCIYIVPAGGGTPRQVTDKVPSYWHGWSPDGRTLAYCARRDGQFDIYSIAVQGGDERRLTQAGGHKDGPDYTPDGRWIWYNSAQGGQMDLWRMRTDGSEAEQMTHDDSVNWFPHPSPDRRHVLYLAYPAGTDGHPANRNVALRLLSMHDGSTRTLVQLVGGQGTINVPCWSPDGRYFAYMRYG